MKRIREVHIAPLGYEIDRLVEPIREYRADVIYLLTHNSPLRGQANYHDDVHGALEDAGAEIRTREIDLYDLYDVLGEVTTIVADHPDDTVRVNVSTGNKLAAVGATIACMEESTDAEAYYVHPEERAHDVETEPKTSGYASDELLPDYPIESPSHDEVKVMEYIQELDTEMYTPHKKDLIDRAREDDLAFLRNGNKNEDVSDKAAFGRLDAKIISKLKDRGFIEVEKAGRRKQVRLTEMGEKSLRAFRHKID